jgi:hypothetical protein
MPNLVDRSLRLCTMLLQEIYRIEIYRIEIYRIEIYRIEIYRITCS